MDTADSTEIVSCRNTRCGQQLRIPAGEVLQVTCPTCGMSFTYRPLRTPGERNKGLSPEFQRKAWVMAELMLMIARESMTLLKRNNPAVATKVSQKQEWEAFIEFLKVLFNLADRVGAFYVPVSEYLQFLDALEDAVIDQMNNAFRQQAGPGYDEMPVKLSIAAAFDAGQKFYQPHKFMISEEGAERDAYFKKFGEAVATAMGSRGNTTIVTTVTMCASSSIAAMKALMESADGTSQSAIGQS
ncbi:MAG TPA: hypothetical protein VGQ07_02830 [Nitrospirales bacterium]|jgi:hypothetical protein|nr:hypothetical protein [Nitrospirales bacterium]